MGDTATSLTSVEKKLLLNFLTELSDRFSNDGCNDFELPNDPAHRQLMESVIKEGYRPQDQAQELEFLQEQASSQTSLHTMNSIVLDYLIGRVQKLPTN